MDSQAIQNLLFLPCKFADNSAAFVEELQDRLPIRMDVKQDADSTITIAQAQPDRSVSIAAKGQSVHIVPMRRKKFLPRIILRPRVSYQSAPLLSASPRLGNLPDPPW